VVQAFLLTVTHHHERVIRTAGRYARVSEERRQQLASDYRKLVDNFTLRGAGCRKKRPLTSRGEF
jgi:hypothetical protein